MRLRQGRLYSISLPLREPMRTSYGVYQDKHAIVVVLETERGYTGVAECVAMLHPTYTEETIRTAWQITEEYLIPSLRGRDFEDPQDITNWFMGLEGIRGHRMAKAGVEMALWDAFAAESGTPLHQLLGGAIRDVPVGISIGMSDSIDVVVERAKAACKQGYQRIKLKIAPGHDLVPLQAIRDALPDTSLMADANSSYALSDSVPWEMFDALGLEMIEQPLAYDDLVDHAALQRRIRTPVCLDESIRSAADARRALQLGAAKIVNLKPGRVGGFGESIRLHNIVMASGGDLWCGGMYETGIGRLHNLALLSLPGFTRPTDNGPSNRYFVDDLVDPPVTFQEPGVLRVESFCGVASRVNWPFLEKRTNCEKTFNLGD